LRELTRFPAHNLILDGTVYFKTQQVRGNHVVLSSIPFTTVFQFPGASHVGRSRSALAV
jgi:hypothetical protein